MFPSLKYKFQTWKHIYQTLQHKFQTLKHKILRGEKYFSGRSNEKMTVSHTIFASIRLFV